MTPKAISVAPPMNTADIPPEGCQVIITEVRKVADQWTSIGTMKTGLALTVDYKDEEYSQLFSTDKAVLAGSIGRLLVSVDINDTDDPNFDAKIQALVGKTVKVVRKGGKIYWYP